MGPPPKNSLKSSAARKSTNTSAKPASTTTKSTNTSVTTTNAILSGKKKAGGGRPRKDKENPSSNPDQGIDNIPTASGTNDPVEAAEENRVLKEKLAAVQAEMNQLKAQKITGIETDAASSIKAIPRPKGDAGDKKRGFILIEAMELNKNQTLYNSILDTVRKNVARANLDLTVDFRHQDVEKLSQVFHMTRKKQPYMDRKRFPADWATAEIVKQYLRGQRKMKKRKRQVAADDDDDGNNDDKSEEEDEADDSAELGMKGANEQECDSEVDKDESVPANSKRRRLESTLD